MIKNCLRCKNKFKSSPSDEAKYCSKQCYNPPLFRGCKICQKTFRIQPYMLKSERKEGRFCSRKCMYQNRKGLLKENAHAYKGDKAKYSAIHMWNLAHFEKNNVCDFCNRDIYRLEWANISGEYSRNREDWLTLCASCHRKYDNSRRITASILKK